MKKVLQFIMIAIIAGVILPAILIISSVKITEYGQERNRILEEERIKELENIDRESYKEAYKTITDGANKVATEIVERTSEKLGELANPEAALKNYIGEDVWEAAKEINN